MRRTPLRRKTPLRAKTGLRQTAALRSGCSLKPVSAKRAKKNRARRDAVIPEPGERVAVIGEECPEFRLFVSRLACCLDLCPPPQTGVDPCHLRTKRNAGDWTKGVAGQPVGNIFPAMRVHHTEQHKRGIKTFAKMHGRDLESVCRVVGEGYLRGLDPEELSALAIATGSYEGVVFT